MMIQTERFTTSCVGGGSTAGRMIVKLTNYISECQAISNVIFLIQNVLSLGMVVTNALAIEKVVTTWFDDFLNMNKCCKLGDLLE